VERERIAAGLPVPHRSEPLDRRETAGTCATRPGAAEARSVATPLDEAGASELAERISAALASLPARRREVIELARFQGLSYREIADVMGISPQTVANQMTQAMHQLRELLGDRLYEPGESTRSIAFPPARSG
jgi:RNA polymerase sigma factor (sigma-70 family)